MNKKSLFFLGGGILAGLVVFTASITVNHLPTSLFRFFIAFLSGGVIGLFFYLLYSLIIYEAGNNVSEDHAGKTDNTGTFDAENPEETMEAEYLQTSNKISEMMNE